MRAFSAGGRQRLCSLQGEVRDPRRCGSALNDPRSFSAAPVTDKLIFGADGLASCVASILDLT